MIAQGVLSLLAGILYVAMTAIYPVMLSNADNSNGPPPETMWVFFAAYAIIGIFAILSGILNIWSGIRVMRFRQRTFGISAVSIGALAVFTCYCSLTAVALLVYGLIVLLDASVKQAFELGDQGYKPDQIDAMFNPWAQPGNWAPPGGPAPL